MFNHLITNVLLIYLLEIGAAISGSVYLKNIQDPPPRSGLFVFYLWLVVFVEGVGIYPAYAYFSNYTKLGFIEGTLFDSNYWLFNIYNVFKILILSYFFIKQFISFRKQKAFYILTWFIIFTFIIDIFFSGGFFTNFLLFSTVVEAIYIMILILMYYKELMESDRILNFQKSIVFYISVGLLVWHTMVTPLFIYNKYFARSSPEFVSLHSTILQLANIILYGIIILGFWVCLKKGKQRGREIIKKRG